MRAYNLFRRKTQRGVYCAVPEDCVVPSFLRATAWDYDGRVSGEAASLLGFDPEAAETGVRFNGFYLFLGFGRR